MPPSDNSPAGASFKPSNYRWVMVALLVLAMIINYTHRQMFGLLKATVSPEMGWNEQDFAAVVFWFQCAYAIGYVVFGALMDKIGARLGYAIAFTIWNIAHTFTCLVMNGLQFTVARFTLGIGESGAFPASIKAITEWFPQKERALAIGVFNTGSSLGAMLAPFLLPIIVPTGVWFLGIPAFDFFSMHYAGIGGFLPSLGMGWRGAFFLTGLASFVWLVLWLIFYRKPTEHKTINQAELDLITSDPADKSEKVSWLKIIGVKETWAFAIGKFLIDPIWWVWLFWLPDFLGKHYHLDLKTFGPPIIAIYLMSDVGSVAGGWLSSTLIKTGRSVNFARKVTLFVFACLVAPVFFLDGVKDLWTAVLIIGIATAAHQAFSANLYTLPSDLVPRNAVGSVVGFGGTMGAVGGMLMSLNVGFLLQTTGSYKVIFWIAGSVYLLALLFVHLISPKLERTTKLDGVANAADQL